MIWPRGLQRHLLLGTLGVVRLAVGLLATAATYSSSNHVEEVLAERIGQAAMAFEEDLGEMEIKLQSLALALVEQPRLGDLLQPDGRLALQVYLAELSRLHDLDTIQFLDAEGHVLADGLDPSVKPGVTFGEGGSLPEGTTLRTQLVSTSQGLRMQTTASLPGQGQGGAALLVGRQLGHEQLVRLRRRLGVDAALFEGDRLQASTHREDAVLRADGLATAPFSGLAREFAVGGARHLALRRPLTGPDGERLGELRMSISLAPAAAAVQDLTHLFVLGALCVLALAVLLLYPLTRRITRPLRELTAAARKLGGGDLCTQTEVRGPEEVRTLAEAFNTMAQSLRSSTTSLENLQSEIAHRRRAELETRVLEARLQQSHRMEALGRLAGGVALDFNNLLTVIIGNAELLTKNGTNEDDPTLRSARQIEAAGQQASELTRQLMTFSRQQPSSPMVLPPSDLVRDAESLLERILKSNVTLAVQASRLTHEVYIDPGHLRQVLINLAINASDAMPDGGTLTICCHDRELDLEAVAERPDAAPGRYVVIEVQDTGTGLEPEAQARIFEPFFTTKEGASGLGLSTVYGIVRGAGGFVTVESALGVGTTFRVFLPVAAAASGLAMGAVSSSSNPTETAEGVVLLVEDEESVRDVTTRTLEWAGHRVIPVESAEKALAVLRSTPSEIDVLLTDYVLTGMNGRELVRRAATLASHLRAIIVTGYGEGPLEGEETGGIEVLEKPAPADQLLDVVGRAIAARRTDMQGKGS